MFVAKILALAFVATVQARSICLQDLRLQPYVYDVAKVQDDFEDALSEQTVESVHPGYLDRVRRQASLSTNINSDGSENLNLKVPIVRGESNVLSVVGSISGLESTAGNKAAEVKPGPGYRWDAIGGGLALNNINGHSASLTGQHIPDLGNQIIAAGRLAILNSDNHKLGANAFITKTMPNIPNLRGFNTAGGSLDYTFRNKIGGSLGISHTNRLQKTDYSAMGNLNLFRNPSSSLDLNAGFTKSQSPFSTFNHDWRPQAGLGFTKYF